MRTLSSRSFRSAVPDARAASDSDEDLDATISFSGSDDEMPDPPALQQLARAILAWEPALVPAYARLDHVPAELAPFAAFLGRLETELHGQAVTRGEFVGWLKALSTDEAARSRAFRIVSAANGADTALATYQAIRKASQ